MYHNPQDVNMESPHLLNLLLINPDGSLKLPKSYPNPIWSPVRAP